MSRHEYTGNRPNLRIVVGWDRPLETFFAQVWDGGELEEGDLLLMLGGEHKEVETVTALTTQLSPYGEIPRAVLDRLVLEEAFNRHAVYSPT